MWSVVEKEEFQVFLVAYVWKRNSSDSVTVNQAKKKAMKSWAGPFKIVKGTYIRK